MFDEKLQSLSYSAYLKITLPKNQMHLRVHVSLTSFTFMLKWLECLNNCKGYPTPKGVFSRIQKYFLQVIIPLQPTLFHAVWDLHHPSKTWNMTITEITKARHQWCPSSWIVWDLCPHQKSGNELGNPFYISSFPRLTINLILSLSFPMQWKSYIIPQWTSNTQSHKEVTLHPSPSFSLFPQYNLLLSGYEGFPMQPSRKGCFVPHPCCQYPNPQSLWSQSSR